MTRTMFGKNIKHEMKRIRIARIRLLSTPFSEKQILRNAGGFRMDA